MRKSDLHPDLQRTAVAIPGRSGVYAVMPKPVPSSVPVNGCEAHFALARREMDEVILAVHRCPRADLLLRMLNRREAVDSSQIEGTRTSIDDLLLYEVNLGSRDASTDPDAGVTLAYVTAFQDAMAAVKQHGQAALSVELNEYTRR